MSYGSNQEISFSPKKVSKVKTFDADSSFSIEGMDKGSFAIASSKKELKQLMTSDADVVYAENKGRLYLNENGEQKGWGEKNVGGLLANFKGKPELAAGYFEGMKQFDEDALTGHTHGQDGDTPKKTMFTSRKAAKKAAKDFGCQGAHQMGDFWMPCKEHGAMMIQEDEYSGDDYSGYEQSGYDYSGY